MWILLPYLIQQCNWWYIVVFMAISITMGIWTRQGSKFIDALAWRLLYFDNRSSIGKYTFKKKKKNQSLPLKLCHQFLYNCSRCYNKWSILTYFNIYIYIYMNKNDKKIYSWIKLFKHENIIWPTTQGVA